MALASSHRPKIAKLRPKYGGCILKSGYLLPDRHYKIYLWVYN